MNGSPWTEKYSCSCTLKQFWKTLTTKGDEANFNIRRTSHYVGTLSWDSPSLFSIFSWGICFILGIQHWCRIISSIRQGYHQTKKKNINQTKNQIALKYILHTTFQEILYILKHIQNHFSLRQQDLYISVTAKRTLPAQISLPKEIKHVITSTSAE